jgi:hypothetical protein
MYCLLSFYDNNNYRREKHIGCIGRRFSEFAFGDFKNNIFTAPEKRSRVSVVFSFPSPTRHVVSREPANLFLPFHLWTCAHGLTVHTRLPLTA